MKKQEKPTYDELNKLSKDMIIRLFLNMQESFDVLKSQNEKLLRQMDAMQESLLVLTQNRFGRKTEKTETFDPNYQQLSLFDLEEMKVLNEAEQLTENGIPDEPEIETVVKEHVRRKKKGKRDEDLSGFPVNIIEHRIPEDELKERFPNGYYELEPEVYRELEIIPAHYEVNEHHIFSYAAKDNSGIARAPRPERLLKNSICTASLAAYVINQKYVDAMPINRISEEFRRNDLEISRQVLAGWMIKLTDRYLRIIYNAMKKTLLTSKLIHCDETPTKVLEDSKGKNSKNYMWVYHSSERYGTPPVFIYDYQPTRKTEHPRNFLGDYSGILVTDGYQVYHTLQKENPDKLTVSGCWSHSKRKFAEIVKAVGEKTASGTIAAEANRRIAAMYHVDNMCKGKSEKEILENRQQSVRPLVDSYFAWLKTISETAGLDKAGKTYKAVSYSLNQEPYLRQFLNNAIIPMDNNDAERSIRAFCVGKHSWHIIDSRNGADASAMLYSIAETAKANALKPYEYFKYVLEEILLHQDEPTESYVDKLVPWSEELPDKCRKTK
jgi:transposase